MVLSTLIPSAMLNTMIVDIFNGMPVYPITPAVNISGIRLGINEITTILNLWKVSVISKAITTKASNSEYDRFLMR